MKVKIYQSKLWFGDTYHPGDIVGLDPNGWSKIQSKASQAVFTPHTPLLHFFFIGKYISKEKDYVIYESIPSHGVAIGRLSFYDGQKYKVFRINVPSNLKQPLSDGKVIYVNTPTADFGEHIIDEVSRFGREHYGYPSILRMLLGIAFIEWQQWKMFHRLRAITARDMYIYMSNKGKLCTQLVHDVPLKLGVDILPPGDAALPCAFIEALECGKLVEVTQFKAV